MKNRVFIVILLCLIVAGVFGWYKSSFNVQNNTKVNNKDNLDNSFGEEKEDDFLDEIVGKWNAISAVSAETGEKVENLREIFGSSYATYGSYLEFKSDGTFLDAIVPITDGSKTSMGTYEVKRDYNKPGDCYVFLTYSDGTEAKLQKVILDDSNTYYLVLEDFINGYQFTFKK